MIQKTLVIVFSAALNICSSCSFKSKNQDIDPFYTTKSFGDIPTRPLLKPLTLGYDKIPRKWYLEIPFFFKNYLSIDSITEVGVEKSYIYGKIFETRFRASRFTHKDYVFVDKFNIVSRSQKLEESGKDEIRIYPTDTINRTYILPERWYVINVADSTIEAFFSEAKYQTYLKEKGISGKLYNIDSIDRQFIETGILPWFPDSVKVKLKN